MTGETAMKSFLVLGLALICASFGHAAENELTTEAKTVPLPSAASSELRKSISEWPVPDVAASRNAPSSTAEWLAAIAANDADRAQRVQSILDQKPISVEKTDIAGADVFRLVPAQIRAENDDRIFVFLHGGAYVYGQGIGGLGEAILLAERLQIEVVSVDYRMPPSDPFPAAVDDAVAVYEALINDYLPERIALGGTSAGGGLTLATIHKLKQLRIALPGALYVGTPWSDLTKTGDTLFTNEGLDRVLVTYDGGLGAAARLYAGENDLKNPLLSPIYGDFRGFPPTILTTGTRDMFLSDVSRTHRKLRSAGIVADLHVYEGMSHAGYLIAPETPESYDMYREVAAFINRHLD